MRSLFAAIGGICIGIALTSFFHAISRPDMPEASPEGRSARGSAATDEIAALKARIAELEGLLGESATPVPATFPEGAEEVVPSVGGSAGESLTSAEALAALVDGNDMKALSKELEKLLLSGEEGFRILVEFLRSQVQPPKYALWQDQRLGLTLLSLALKHGDPTADLCRFILANTDKATDSTIRDHILRFLPGFLSFSGDRYGELRDELAQTLLADFEQGGAGANLWRSAQVLQELGMEISMDMLDKILNDPAKKMHHSIVFQQLARRADAAAVEVLTRYIDGAQDYKDWALRQAIQTLAQMEQKDAQARLGRYLASPVKEIREAATLSYFLKPRDLSSFPMAMDFLKSDSDLSQKRMLVWQIRGSSPQIMDGVRSEAESFTDEGVKEMLKKDGALLQNIWVQGAAGGAIQIQVAPSESK